MNRTQHINQPENKQNALNTGRPFFQPSLTINQPNDVYEREANHMGGEVMRMTTPGHNLNVFFKPSLKNVQRKCQHCEEEKVQRMETVGTEVRGSNELNTYVAKLGSSGQDLPTSSRYFFEPRFGHDFSNVRIHTDAVAAKSAQSINALAYTSANHIVFNSGQYSPESSGGKKLLAHELTHVVQQGQGLSNKIQRLGTNPACTQAEADKIHQAIYDGRAWINNALAKIDQTPRHERVMPALRSNFGPTYGVEDNLPLITGRIRTVYQALGSMSFACDTPGTTHWCAASRGGWSLPGSNAATICTNPTSTLDFPTYAIHTIIHEAFHASMSFMTVDNYSATPGYPC